jgi:hypothetical protein
MNTSMGPEETQEISDFKDEVKFLRQTKLKQELQDQIDFKKQKAITANHIERE